MVLDIVTSAAITAAGALAAIFILIYLFRGKNFTNKYVDIKEAPLQINNTLKDNTKRDIIISLRKEKKYLTLIADETHDSVAKTKYHLHELEKQGIIASMKLTREKFFMLTERGKMCLKAIHTYYPKNNFERIVNRIEFGQLVWKEKKKTSKSASF